MSDARSVRVPIGELAPRQPLTARQLEVVACVGDGMTYPQIAKALGISPRTVEVHVARISDLLPGASRPYQKVSFYAFLLEAERENQERERKEREAARPYGDSQMRA